MVKIPHKDEGNTTADILEFLIIRYSDKLNITLSSFPEHFARTTGISSRAAFNWIQKKRSKPFTLRANSRVALSEYFEKAIPIPPIWFSIKDIEQFKEKVLTLETSMESREYPCFGVPRNKIFFTDIQKLKEDIAGVYILYRFIFSLRGNNEFIREIIHIYEDGQDLKFISYYATSIDTGDYHSSFHGTCIPTGQTINLSGTEWGHYQRSRTFLFAKDNSAFSPKKFLFGVLLSTNLHQNMPCAAKVLLMRYMPHDTFPVKNVKHFSEKICKYSGDIITQDFGENANIIKVLISNQLGGSQTTLTPPREKAELLFIEEQIHKNWSARIKLSL